MLQKFFEKRGMFVHTFVERDAIITLVNPNTLYSFCYTP